MLQHGVSGLNVTVLVKRAGLRKNFKGREGFHIQTRFCYLFPSMLQQIEISNLTLFSLGNAGFTLHEADDQ